MHGKLGASARHTMKYLLTTREIRGSPLLALAMNKLGSMHAPQFCMQVPSKSCHDSSHVIIEDTQSRHRSIPCHSPTPSHALAWLALMHAWGQKVIRAMKLWSCCVAKQPHGLTTTDETPETGPHMCNKGGHLIPAAVHQCPLAPASANPEAFPFCFGMQAYMHAAPWRHKAQAHVTPLRLVCQPY